MEKWITTRRGSFLNLSHAREVGLVSGAALPTLWVRWANGRGDQTYELPEWFDQRTLIDLLASWTALEDREYAHAMATRAT